MTSITEKRFWTRLSKKVAKIILKNAGVRTSPRTHNQHVVPYDGEWAVKGEGNSKPTGIFDTQEEAIRRAKQIAKNYKSDVIIHRRDGTIRDRISYD